MAFDVTAYLPAVAVGTDTATITKNVSDAFTSGAYAAWVQSITGDTPEVVQVPGENRAKIVLTSEQAATMRQWIESQMTTALHAKTPSRVQYEISPVIAPLAAKYSIPAALLLIGAGFAAAWMLK